MIESYIIIFDNIIIITKLNTLKFVKKFKSKNDIDIVDLLKALNFTNSFII